MIQIEFDDDCEERFSELLAKTHLETQTPEYSRGYADGLETSCRIVDNLRKRAVVSDEPGTDTAAQILAVLLSELEKGREDVDKVSDNE